MAKLRSVSTSFWSDPFIEELSPSDKLLFLYLVTNDKTNMLGIYEVSIRKISFDTGIPKETVANGLKGFEMLGKIQCVGNYIILINYMKHQHFNTNMKKSAIDAYNALPNELKIKGLVVDKSNPLEGFERLLKGLGMVPKVEVEVEVESEVEYIKSFNFKNELLKLEADKDLVDDWLKVRKTKKATNTKTALKGFLKKVEDSGLPLNTVLKYCVENSWKGFDRSWIQNLQSTSAKPINPHANPSSISRKI